MRMLFWAVLCVPWIGCATSKVQFSTDRAGYTDVSGEEIARHGKCGLKACIMSGKLSGFEGTCQAIALGSLGLSIVYGPGMNGADCEIGLKYQGWKVADSVEVYSAYSGEFLAHVRSNYQKTGAVICRALAPGSALRAKLDAQKREFWAARGSQGPRPAAPPAPLAPPEERVSREAVPPAGGGIDSPSYRSSPRPDDFAIVVGVEKYSGIPEAPYAERDAAAMVRHLEALGVPRRNIIALSGDRAVSSALKKYVESWLPKNVKPESRVYFFFSGHGAPDAESGTAYLLPWDGDPSFLPDTAYPLKRLYDRLGALKAKEVIVALDACFSGAGGRSVLAKGARPLVLKVEDPAPEASVTVLTAASSSQIAGSLPELGHGAFTYFLLKGLNGEAADASGRVTVEGLHDYLSPLVQDEARRQNREQTPVLRSARPITLR